MKIKLIAIGKKMPDWVQIGVNHYQKQIPNFELVALESQKRKNNNVEKIKIAESELLIQAAHGSNLIIALDETGIQHTTKAITERMKNWQNNAENVSLLIGGADGLSDECKKQAHQVWGLSNLTLPHSMARLLAVEQIYRAHSLLTSHPYHRE